jgi:uncharacterized membrane protein YvbJ
MAESITCVKCGQASFISYDSDEGKICNTCHNSGTCQECGKVGFLSVMTQPKDGVKRCLSCGAAATSKYYDDLHARNREYRKKHPFKTLRDKVLAIAVFIILAIIALIVFKFIGANFPLINF